MTETIQGVEIRGDITDEVKARVLTPEALAFVRELHRKFNPVRLSLLERRKERMHRLETGELPQFLAETADVRKGNWTVGKTPPDLLDRRVEITGPAEAKMMINAFNSGARAFMCDLEDAQSPTWKNVTEGQLNLQHAVRKTLAFTNEAGKQYKLNDKIATLLVRPRGWHLPEKHILVDGERASGSLVDFGLYFFHNAKETLERGSGPYFYLPKMESHREARLWNDVFNWSQDSLAIPRGTIKATVLIETIMAAFEMDEILYELKEHITGLNAGRWDYIFSIIKKFSFDPSRVLPDRAQITMATSFMQAYSELLVQTCHKRDAHAMGGMAAFIPSRKDEEVNRVAIAKVNEDKLREAKAGFDGTWVAHPDLVPVAAAVFDEVVGQRPHQKEKKREDVHVTAQDLIRFQIPKGKITEHGVSVNIDVALQYMRHWIAGLGAVALHNLMEDAATAEISRAQLWQWVHHKAQLDDGRTVTPELYRKLRDQELAKLPEPERKLMAPVVELLDGLVLSPEFCDFLTLPAYERLQ